MKELVLTDTGGDGRNGMEAVEVTPVRKATWSRPARYRRLYPRQLLSGLSLLGADLLILGGLTLLLQGWGAEALGSVYPTFALATWVTAGLMLLGISLLGCYSTVVMHPAAELRRLTIVTGLVYALPVGSLLIATPLNAAHAALLGGSWLAAVVVVPMGHLFARLLLARTEWWGVPVLVLATGGAGELAVHTMRRWPELGLRPVGVLSDHHPEGEMLGGVPVVGRIEDAPQAGLRLGVRHAIVALSGQSHREVLELLERYSRYFRQLFVLPENPGMIAFWSTARSFEGLLGYGVQHSYWNLRARMLKRAMDIVGASILLLLLSPLFAVVALLIKLDSSRPVFYRQMRMGRGGRCFPLLKFRTMYQDADRRLQELLREHPDLREEYELFHKLRNDPRVTRVGRYLRRFSIDELPQLWNVLRGDLSLVGPRAYMPEERHEMDGMDRIILQKRPGVTGLWQVSGRNGLTFEDRVRMDVHYIHNWTPWLDLYILARTVPVVLTGEGAC
ncbi:Undecaprenyl-phosphate galactose phosphotransferase, WbaP [Rhodothermus marinus SG0.5JP17-172]|nr:Undecaprenyl-phosphate galactose phosphotransferase, WbaP [Rhodothermus marinus SG0.5JP17-172]